MGLMHARRGTNGRAGLRDRRPLDAIQLGKLRETVGPEGGPITVHLDDEDPGRGLEAGLEDLRSRFVELACKKERILEPWVLGLVTVPRAGRQEAHGEKGKGGSGSAPTSYETLLVRQIEPLA